MKIQRYGLGREYAGNTGSPAITEQADGAYVRYEDHQRLQGACEAHNEMLLGRLKLAAGAQPSDLDALSEQCNRLQDALAFYMPDVPEAGHPLHERIAQDAYLLCGYDGGDSNEPSAQALGHISLNAQPDPEMAGEEISDDMVERACRVQHVGWSIWHEPQKKTARDVMRHALTSALSLSDSSVQAAATGDKVDTQPAYFLCRHAEGGKIGTEDQDTAEELRECGWVPTPLYTARQPFPSMAVDAALLDMLETLCNGLEWNIENHPEVMNESDAETLAQARALLKRVQPANGDDA